MKSLLLLFFMITATTGLCRAGVVFEGPVESRILGTNRFVRIYLPPSYEAKPRRRYPVLYLHDGQNVFTTVGDNVAFGWGNWQLDKTVTELSQAGKMQEIIMVAVDCSRERYLDYRGPAYPYTEKELEALRRRPQGAGDDTHFKNYARFLIEELKPKIDREYRTRKTAKDTAVMGSSLGGICSLALAWSHPKVFGQAASLSGSFQIENRHFLNDLLRPYQGKAKPFRVYLDSGVVDYSGGDDGAKNTQAVADELRRIGWHEGRNLQYFLDAAPLVEPELEKTGLRRDKWSEARRSQHNEFYWRLRAWRALTFLFPPR